jgi:hypothetical protein
MAAITITPASVLKSSTGSRSSGIAGETITPGQALYIMASGKMGLSDANGAAPANTCAGISENGASLNQPVSYVTADTAGFTIGATILAGDMIWVHTTPGAITKTFADLISGCAVIPLGSMLSTTTLALQPLVGGVVA